jgi:hypothetical protein
MKILAARKAEAAPADELIPYDTFQARFEQQFGYKPSRRTIDLWRLKGVLPVLKQGQGAAVDWPEFIRRLRARNEPQPPEPARRQPRRKATAE